jgi:NTE family protein
MTRKITNLVFQGGSVKGAAYVGAIDALEENGVDMAAIKRVAGASAGAITACALALVAMLRGLKNYLKNLNLKKCSMMQKVQFTLRVKC